VRLLLLLMLLLRLSLPAAPKKSRTKTVERASLANWED
jgi:hypothetical protein